MSQPEIVARFETDAEGLPEFNQGSDKKHYKLVLEVKNAPPDVYVAQFELDPTYYDPLRTVRPDDEGRFVLRTTSYGDYPVTVTLMSSQGTYEMRERLSQALAKGMSDAAPSPTLKAALTEIETN